MKDLTIKASTPCHSRPVRLLASAYVAVERYERVCERCGFEWTIERRSVRDFDGIRLDALDWMSTEALERGMVDD